MKATGQYFLVAVFLVSLPLSPRDHPSVRACVDIDWLGSWLRDRYYACIGCKK